MSYRDRKIYVYLVFNKEVELKEPRTIMDIDVNFDNATYTIIDLNGNLISMVVIPFRGLNRALHLKKLSEDLQKRYLKSWRFLKWARRARARWIRRAKNILVDSPHIALPRR